MEASTQNKLGGILLETSTEAGVPRSIEVLATRIRQLAGVSDRAPIDLKEILRRFQIDGPYEFDSPLDGQLRMDVVPPVILVNQDHTETRKRFTIAHELGHFVFRKDILPCGSIQPLVDRFRSEEHFCDSFAGALLLPATWLRLAHPPSAQSGEEHLSSLIRIADEAKVSPSSALVRLRQVQKWQLSLLEWRVVRGKWFYEWDRGLHPSDYGRVETNHQTLDILWSVRSAPRSENGTPSVQPPLPLVVDGVESHFQVQYLVRGSMVCAALRLPSPRGESMGAQSWREVA